MMARMDIIYHVDNDTIDTVNTINTINTIKRNDDDLFPAFRNFGVTLPTSRLTVR